MIPVALPLLKEMLGWCAALARVFCAEAMALRKDSIEVMVAGLASVTSFQLGAVKL
jgi:hypothetical protein